MSGLYQLLDEDGALPQCEQCFPTGSSKPIDIHLGDDGPVGFSVTKTWAHKPFREPDCRWVYLCRECFYQVQVEAYTGEETWFATDVYRINPDCLQCQQSL